MAFPVFCNGVSFDTQPPETVCSRGILPLSRTQGDPFPKTKGAPIHGNDLRRTQQVGKEVENSTS